MERKDEVPNDIENPCDPLVKELDNLFPLSPLRCIYRVPKRLRQENEEAYTPQVVSIGPLHHGKERLKAMEEHKKRCLQEFLDRTQVSYYDYLNKIKGREARLRSCYAEPIAFDSEKFVRIVLVDAAFIIEYLLRVSFSDILDKDDYIFHKPWMKLDVWLDLQMLENQLPFFILEDLWDPHVIAYLVREDANLTDMSASLINITYHVWKCSVLLEGMANDLEAVRSSKIKVTHLLDFLRILCLPLKRKPEGKLKTRSTPSIAELHQAGVKFKVKKLFDISFADGILEIPKLEIDDYADIKLRNLIAFEQCHYEYNEKYICDYTTVMDWFMNTPKDVELLVKYGIVGNHLGSHNEASTLINRLGNGLSVEYDDFYFATVCNDLNDYCKTCRHQWMATLKQNYFNTPWTIISVVAAVLLLILTFTQTVCSIISIPK